MATRRKGASLPFPVVARGNWEVFGRDFAAVAGQKAARSPDRISVLSVVSVDYC